MSNFNYSLNREDYSLKNALLWGNFSGHLQKAQSGTLGNRIIHVLIAGTELLPIISQIASLFEYIIITTFEKAEPNVPVEAEKEDYTGPDQTATLPADMMEYIAGKLDIRDAIALSQTNRRWNEKLRPFFERKIANIFGPDFIGKRDPIEVASQIWGSIIKKSDKLEKRVIGGFANPPSKEMLNVLNSIRREGKLDELKQAIQSLVDPEELKLLRYKQDTVSRVDFGEYPLLGNNPRWNSDPRKGDPIYKAVFFGTIEMLRVLIDANTPISRVRIDVRDDPLYVAANHGKPDMLRFLLENGAVCDAPYSLYARLKDKLPYEINDGIVQCFAIILVLMRDQGKRIATNKFLAADAGDFLMDPKKYKFARLLMSFGVVPIVDQKLLNEKIGDAIYSRNKKYFDHLHEQRLLDFLKYEHEGRTLADIARFRGNFEMEEYFVKEKNAPYKCKEKMLKKLAHRMLKTLSSNVTKDDDQILKCWVEWIDNQSWEFHMKIISDYNIDLNELLEDNEPCILKICRALNVENLTRLKVRIADLVTRGADLDFKIEGQPTPRELIAQAELAAAANVG